MTGYNACIGLWTSLFCDCIIVFPSKLYLNISELLLDIFVSHFTAPPKAPLNLSCPGTSPYTISVRWHEFKIQETGGSLTGYVLRYKVKGDPGNKTEIKLGPHPPWYSLENLPIFTEYEIEVLVENVKGRSSWASVMCKTSEGGRLGYFLPSS